jgi:hypothetical protein
LICGHPEHIPMLQLPLSEHHREPPMGIGSR